MGNDYEDSENTENVRPSSILDEFKISGSIVSHPVVENGVVFFGSCDTYFYALDAKTGHVAWKFKTGGPICCSPVLSNDLIYFGSFDGYFYALDKTGKETWKYFEGSSIFSRPAVVNNKIYFGSKNGALTALSKDGNFLWKFNAGDAITSSPVVINDVVYFGSYDKCFYAVKDGIKQWCFFAGGPVGSPIVAADLNGNELFSSRKRTIEVNSKDVLLFFGSWDQHLYCLSLDGKLIWKFIADGALICHPAIHNKTIYAFSNDHNLYAITFDGKLKWKFMANESSANMYPLIHENVIYFGSRDKNLYAVDMNGKMLWRFLTGGEIWSSPWIEDNVLYFGSFDTNFYAISLKDKRVLWKFQTGLPTQLKSDDMFKILNFNEKLIKLKKMLVFWKRETKKSEYETNKSFEEDTNKFFYTPMTTYKNEMGYKMEHPYTMKKDR
jgi:outer membrane protein assembly factor BamB